MSEVITVPVEIECPRGCDGQCSLEFCLLCSNSGWVPLEQAREYREEQERRASGPTVIHGFTIERKIIFKNPDA